MSKIEWIERKSVANKTTDYSCHIGEVLEMLSRKAWMAEHLLYQSNRQSMYKSCGTYDTPELAQQAVIDAEVAEIKRRLEQVGLLQWLNLPVVEDGRCSKKCMYSYPCCDSGGREYFGCRYKRKKHTGNSPHPDCIAACASK